MDTSLKNQSIKVGPLVRERIMSIVGMLLIPLLYVVFLSESSNYDQEKRLGIIVLIAIFVLFFIRTLLFQIKAADTGITVRKFLISRHYSYEEIDEIRIINHAAKQNNTVEIRGGGKRIAFYNDFTKNSDLFIEKLNQHGVLVTGRTSI